jgi:hypothetical protein
MHLWCLLRPRWLRLWKDRRRSDSKSSKLELSETPIIAFGRCLCSNNLCRLTSSGTPRMSFRRCSCSARFVEGISREVQTGTSLRHPMSREVRGVDRCLRHGSTRGSRPIWPQRIAERADNHSCNRLGRCVIESTGGWHRTITAELFRCVDHVPTSALLTSFRIGDFSRRPD